MVAPTLSSLAAASSLFRTRKSRRTKMQDDSPSELKVPKSHETSCRPARNHLADLKLHLDCRACLRPSSNADLSQPQMPGVWKCSHPAMPRRVSSLTLRICWGRARAGRIFYRLSIGVYRHHSCRLIMLADDPARHYYASGHR